MASCTTPTRHTSVGWTASGACTRGSTARHSVATRPASGGAATTSTTASETMDTQRMAIVTQDPAPAIRLNRPAGRWVLLATVLGSSMAFLDATVVNVALPTIGRNLGASLGGLQWTVTAYTLTLAGLILLGGALGDRLGRRRIFVIGVTWFALASALCGLAPDIGVLIGARALQGVGGALLTPGSLAIIQASFVSDDRPRAVGAWSGLGGVAGAAGPLLGGWIVQAGGWRRCCRWTCSLPASSPRSTWSRSWSTARSGE